MYFLFIPKIWEQAHFLSLAAAPMLPSEIPQQIFAE
jgi:hypothetical protein